MRFLLLLLCLGWEAPIGVKAWPQVTSPSAGDAFQGGEPLNVTWEENDQIPLLTDLSSYQIGLYTGNNSNPISLGNWDAQPFQNQSVDFGALYQYIEITANMAPNALNVFFIGINSTLAQDNSVQITTYSPRFTLENMTGTFQDQSPSVESINDGVAGSAKPSAVFNCGPTTCSRAKALAGLTLDGTTFPSVPSSTSKSTSRPTSTPASTPTQTPIPITSPNNGPSAPSTKKGIIIGVTVLGVVLLLAILGGIWAFYRSKKGKSGNRNGGKMHWYRAMTLNSLKNRANSLKVYSKGQAKGPEGKGNYENLVELPAGFAGRGVDHRRRPVEVPEISGGLGLEDGENALGLLMTGARVPGESDRSSFESMGVSEDEPGLINRNRISELPAHAEDGDFHRAIQESLAMSGVPTSPIPMSAIPKVDLGPAPDELFMGVQEAKPELPKRLSTIGADPFMDVEEAKPKLPERPSTIGVDPFVEVEEGKPELPERPTTIAADPLLTSESPRLVDTSEAKIKSPLVPTRTW